MSYEGLAKKYWRVGGPEHLEMWCIKKPMAQPTLYFLTSP